MSAAAATASLPPAPAGWREVDIPVGEPIAGTNIILMKAPISPSKFNVPPKFSFTPTMMIEQQKALGRRPAFMIEVSVRTAAERDAGVKPVLDTSTFYEPLIDLQPHGVKFVHAKIDLVPVPQPLPGADPTKAPCPVDADSIKRFVTLLRGLVAETEREKEKQTAMSNASTPAAAASSSSSSSSLEPFIYLHDLYGFNLVGFLVACYLVEEGGMDVLSAANDVADSRPPGIYISTLFQALVNRYFPGEQALAGDQAQPIPVIPDLPRPDFHQVPWTGLVSKPAAASSTTSTTGGGGDESAPQAEADVPGETFKRKARKKPTPAAVPPPPPSAASSSSSFPSSNGFSPAAAAASSASYASSAHVAGVKRPFEDSEDEVSKRAKLSATASPGSSLAPVASSNSSIPAATSSLDTSSLLRSHPFLVPLKPIQASKLSGALTSLFPVADSVAMKAGQDLWSLLAPPSVTQSILQRIVNHGVLAPYSLSWLPKHIPCFMLLQRTEVYLVMSQQDWFLVPQLHFPKRKAMNENVNNTLLLGELILDPTPQATPTETTTTFQSRFLATDLLVMSQTVLSRLMPLEKRLQTLDIELIQPLKQVREQLVRTNPNQTINLHIRNKMMFPLAKVESVLNMKVGHGNLGIVFQMNGKQDAPYQEGYKLVFKREQPQGVDVAAILKLAQSK